MHAPILIATENGLLEYSEHGQSWRKVGHHLAGHNVTSVMAREGVILAGTTDGIYRSQNLGTTWEEASRGLSERHVRWLAFHPDISDAEFAGTEPAGIFVSRNGGDSWQSRPEVARLRDDNGWFLPYSPEAGCVRGFAFHGPRAYAAVEVGGVLRSDDGGDTWQLAPGSDGNPDFGHRLPPSFVHSDVHSIEVHPTSPDAVLAATNAGLYRSHDGGHTWLNLYPRHYCRALWVDPHNVDHLILGPADGVDRNGRIVETTDGGQSWHDISTGLPTPWPRQMVERLTQIGEALFAVLSGGALLMTSLGQPDAWQEILPATAAAQAVTAMVE